MALDAEAPAGEASAAVAEAVTDAPRMVTAAGAERKARGDAAGVEVVRAAAITSALHVAIAVLMALAAMAAQATIAAAVAEAAVDTMAAVVEAREQMIPTEAVVVAAVAEDRHSSSRARR